MDTGTLVCQLPALTVLAYASMFTAISAVAMSMFFGWKWVQIANICAEWEEAYWTQHRENMISQLRQAGVKQPTVGSLQAAMLAAHADDTELDDGEPSEIPELAIDSAASVSEEDHKTSDDKRNTT